MDDVLGEQAESDVECDQIRGTVQVALSQPGQKRFVLATAVDDVAPGLGRHAVGGRGGGVPGVTGCGIVEAGRYFGR